MFLNKQHFIPPPIMKKVLLITITAVAALFWYWGGLSESPQLSERGKAPSALPAAMPQVMPPPLTQPVTQPELESLPAPIREFREWFAEYEANQTVQSLELGKEYAKQHTREIARLIKADPQLAIANAVPMVVRQKLPGEILALLEERVRVRGNYEVYGNVPLEGQEATTEPYTRTVTTTDGKRWKAHVFGKRQWQRSTLNASLNGVAVGKDMAVSDSPIRVLEVGEIPADDGREIVESCPVSGIETEVEKEPDGALAAVSEETPAFETPERVIYVCSGGHISQLAEQYMSDEEKAHWEQLGTDLYSGTGSGTPHGPISTTIPSGWTTGNRTFLYIRACFPDNPVDPQNEQECLDMLKTANDYVVQTSYGRCYLTYAVAPLVVLPYPLLWYLRYDEDVGKGDYLIEDHAIQIAKTMGYDAASYNLRAVRWAGGPGSYSGSASVGGAGMRMRTSSSGTFIHELGHNLGLRHSNYWRTTPPSVTGPGNNLEYGNIFDAMGKGANAGQFTASFKNTLSWMPPEQFWNVTSSGLYRIHQTDASIADPSLRYAVRVRRDAERDFWAEFRLRHTTNVGFTNGLMMTFDQWGLGGIGGSGGAPLNGSNRGAQLLDMTPGSFSNTIADTRDDSALWVGRTFSDPDFNIHFTPVAKNEGTTPPSMDVQIHIGDAPGNNAPTLSVAASATSAAANANVTLTATATDPDGDSLAYAWVFDDGTYSLNNSAVQTKSWSDAGHYQVLCTASDMKGKRTTKSVLITVGSPGTFTVSGNVTGPDALPLEGVYVANYAPSNNTSHTNSATFRGTWTDSDGNYTLTGITAGSYSFTPNLYPLVFTPSGFANPLTISGSTTGIHFTSASLPAVTISYPDDVAAEGDVANPATIRLTREGSTTAALSVQLYNVNTGSATRNTDYTLSPAPTAGTSPDGGSGTSQYIIPAGAEFLDITLTPVQDTAAEGVEVASLDFVNTAQGYIMAGNPKAQVAITDDESSLPVVKLTPVDDSGSEAGTDTLTLKVERNGPTTGALVVRLAYSTGTAVRNTDFNSPTGVTIPAGSESTTFKITPINDSDIETTETIVCSITTNAAYIRSPLGAEQTVTCQLNDDDMPTVSIVATDASASETGPDRGLFTITRTGSPLADLTVDYSMAGSAMHGTDYRRLDGRSTIPAGQSSITVEIMPFDDELDEGTQDVVLQLRTAQAYFISPTAQTATVTISDNDDSQMYVEMNTGRGIESDSGSSNGPIFEIHRPASGIAITVNYTISGTATSGADFTALPGSIAFAAGDTNKTIAVSILADTDLEDAETIVLTLEPGTGYSLLAGQNHSATGWIYDGDQPTVEVNAADGTSGLTLPFTETSTTTGADFFITRRVATASELIVNYTLSGTATSGDDYVALSGTATIPANATGVYVNVMPINDTLPEGMESITMTLTPEPGVYGVRIGSATLLLGDNDSFTDISVGFANNNSSTMESVGTYNLPVNITGTPAGDVSVQYRVNGGTAAGNGIDFTLAEGLLTFPSGTTTLNIPIVIRADQLPEPAETVIVQLVKETGANISTRSHTLTINNVSMPEAFTDPASAILVDGATLNGRVMPGGLATTYWFEYGPTTAYGSSTTTQNLAAGNTITAVTFVLTGATLTTHYRLVAQNDSGITRGINQTFTASPSAEIVLEQSGSSLVDGSAVVDYGVMAGGTSSRTLTIRNTGNAPLTGLGLGKTGDHAGDFTLSALSTTTLAQDESTTFSVTFSPGGGGIRTAALQITSNDADESPFDIALTGTAPIPGGNVADNFDDNVLNPAMWLNENYTEPSQSKLTESSKRLNYTATVETSLEPGFPPVVSDYGESHLTLLSSQPRYTEDWEAVVDVTNTVATGTAYDLQAGLLMKIYDSSPASENRISLELRANARREFSGDMMTGGVDDPNADDELPTLGTNTTGVLRVAFHAGTKVFTLSVDRSGRANGLQWETVATYGIAGTGGSRNADWGMTDTDSFQIHLAGLSDSVAVTSGQMYFDNFRLTRGGVSPPVITLQPASMTIVTGQSTPLSVGTSGFPLSYQWYAGSTGDTSQPIAGARGANFTTPALTAQASYWVRVSNSLGSEDSDTTVISISTTPLAPYFATQPLSQLALLGQAITLNLTVTGSDPLTYQWLKGTTKVTNAKASSLTLAPLKTTDAGLYSLRAMNNVGTWYSDTAYLGIVTRGPAAVGVKIGTTLTLNAVVTVPRCTTASYLWHQDGVALNNGGRRSGVDTKTLKITGAEPTDAGNYTCQITMVTPAGDVLGNNAETVVSVVEKPVFDAVELASKFDDVRVGQSIDFTITADNAPTKFIITGLPAGVKLDAATGRIYGIPTAARIVKGVITPYTLKISASNMAGVSSVETVLWTVQPLYPSVIGTYNGLVVHDAVNQNLGGTLKLTVASTAALSGTLKLGALSYKLVGRLNFAGINDTAAGQIIIPRKAPLTTLALAFEINQDTGELTGTVANDKSGPAEISAWLATWSKTNQADDYMATYNTALDPDGGEGPEGFGFMPVKVTNIGTVSWAGKLADGTSITGSTSLGPDGQIAFQHLLYTNMGSIQGWLTITNETGHLDGTVNWFKPQQPVKSTTRNYKQGFSNPSLTAIGAPYVKPAAAVLDLPTTSTLNAKVMMLCSNADFPVDAEHLFTITSGNIVTPDTPNDYAMKLSLAATTGTFSGSISFSNDDPTDLINPIAIIKRTVSYTGILVTREDFNQGVGYFIVDELPFMQPIPHTDPPREKRITATPKWSGRAKLEAVP